MKFLKENLTSIYEGFFWIINNKIEGTIEEVPKYGYEYKQSKTHKETWHLFNKYNVEYDYYPRGRVMVDPEYNDDKTFKEFTAMVFLDPCINNKEIKEQIIDYYNLNLASHINWMGNLKQRAGINHYSCNNCRGK